MGIVGCSSTTTAVSKYVTIIDVTPSPAPDLPVGSTLQFTAKGTFSDGSIENITNEVTWVSGNTDAATINSSGVATGVAFGTTPITATMEGKTSSIVDLAVISNSSITLRQAPQVNLTVDSTQQFTATGIYYDGSTANISSLVSWFGNAPAKATIDSGDGRRD